MPRSQEELLEGRKLRLLMWLYDRERLGNPAWTKEKFRQIWWDTILDLTVHGQVTQFPDVRLTAAGRRAVRRHLAKTQNHQTDIGTDDNASDEPEDPGHFSHLKWKILRQHLSAYTRCTRRLRYHGKSKWPD